VLERTVGAGLFLEDALANLNPQLVQDAKAADTGHPSVETRTFHAGDDWLRKNGFVIHSRPKTGEPIWRGRDGSLLQFSKAIEQLEEKKKGKK
ncbi:hypothetical protein, partial [Pseudomonas aeruginosa]|uniref:hypothetical protein n=1 Tax=Pseudomonas aeruginosa TaxID=287 RepID=UPI001C65C8DB